MTADNTVVVSSDRRQDLERYITSLPEILSGREFDQFGIVPSMHARVGHTLLGFIQDSFEEKGRGRADESGDKWGPLSPAYLAYKRPVTGRDPPRAGKSAPGNKDGYLDAAQLKQWQRIYGQTLRWAIGHYPLAEAKALAAAKAWTVLKSQGAETKLGTFGQRKAGADYQTLVDTGALRRSLQPGTLRESGATADYTPATTEQIYESRSDSLVIGSRDRTAGFHHFGKGRRKRRLWPEHFPSAWWQEVLGQVTAGVMQFTQFFGGRGA